MQKALYSFQMQKPRNWDFRFDGQSSIWLQVWLRLLSVKISIVPSNLISCNHVTCNREEKLKPKESQQAIAKKFFATVTFYWLQTEKQEVLSMKVVPIWEKSNLTLEEAAAYSGIGISKLRELSDTKDCPFVLWNGTKRLLKRRKLDEHLERAFSI